MENRRNLVGQTAAASAAIVELEQAVPRYGANSTALRSTPRAIFAARDTPFPELPAPECCAPGAVHAAAFADLSGRLLAVREDVGRHNALDKLIGHLARAAIDRHHPASCLMTSRISFELVQKCLAARIPALVGIPPLPASPCACRRNIGTFGRVGVRTDGFQVFSDPYGLWPDMAERPIT